MVKKKITVGLVEPVKVKGVKREVKILGKFDTGAERTSIDRDLVSKIGVDHIGKTTTFNVHGKTIRPLVNLKLKIKEKTVNVKANVWDRSSRKYKILIGRDAIFSNFVVDISKTHKSHKLRDLR